jgi:cytochrome c-type biogenesis protein CcmH
VRRLAAVLALLLVVLAPVASAATPQFSEEQLETEVMCPVCGTRLDLSHSPAADQIRAFIEQKRDAGWTKQQVKDALVAQFGERILATTPTTGSGLFAWLVPVIAGVAGVAIAVGLVVAGRRRPPRTAPASAAAPLDDEARRRVDEALRDFE